MKLSWINQKVGAIFIYVVTVEESFKETEGKSYKAANTLDAPIQLANSNCEHQSEFPNQLVGRGHKRIHKDKLNSINTG